MSETGVPYHRAVEGPDGRWNWAQCPECGEVVKNRDGFGPARHWTAKHGCEYPGCLGPADGSECRHPGPEEEAD